MYNCGNYYYYKTLNTIACGFYDIAYDGMVSTQVEINDIIVLCNVFGLLI